MYSPGWKEPFLLGSAKYVRIIIKSYKLLVEAAMKVRINYFDNSAGIDMTSDERVG